MSRRARTTVALVAGVLCAMTALPVGPAAADGTLDGSRRAAEGLRFSGRMIVRWVDERGTHTDDLDVRASDGVLLVEGPASVMATKGERLLRHEGKSWDRLWPAALSPLGSPWSGDKYGVTVVGGRPVAGRSTYLVELRRRGRLQERMYVDPATRLVVRRDQLDAEGRVRRSVRFEELTTEAVAKPRAPAKAVDHSPRPVKVDGLASRYRAPQRLREGYRRIGLYRRGPTVQVLYSDGLYGLSVFQQPGRLSHRASPPASPTVRVRRAVGHHWSWPGGEVVQWQAGGMVFTAVGDGPFDELLAAARSLKPGRAPSVLGQVRRACEGMVRAFV